MRAVRGFVVIAALVFLGRGTVLPAQSFSSPTAPTFRMTSLDSSPRPDPHTRRIYPAATVGLVSGLALGFVGYMIAGSPCIRGCDLLSRNHVIGGAVIGEIFGSAYGAALSRGRGLCTREERYVMALGGAFVGALASAGFAQYPPGRISILAVIPLGSVMFLKGC